MRIAILLLYTCGLRRGELLNLRLADYNHSETTLFIRATKFHKQRIIPLSETVGKELHNYLCYCCQKGVKMDSNTPLICSYPSNEKKWQPYTGTGLHGNWRYLCAGLGILTPQGIPPRIHDLRHSFAVNSLLHLYQTGQNVQSKLPFLSTYMGHGCIASTHYYLSFVEPLLSTVNDRFEQAFGNLGDINLI
jgi:integrase